MTASSVPAVATHTKPVDTAATTQEATKTDQKGGLWVSPMKSQTTSQMITAWPVSPSRTAPTQPSRTASCTSTGRSTAPATAISTAPASARSAPPMSKSGTTREAIPRPSADPSTASTARPASPRRRCQDRVGVRGRFAMRPR